MEKALVIKSISVCLDKKKSEVLIQQWVEVPPGEWRTWGGWGCLSEVSYYSTNEFLNRAKKIIAEHFANEGDRVGQKRLDVISLPKDIRLREMSQLVIFKEESGSWVIRAWEKDEHGFIESDELGRLNFEENDQEFCEKLKKHLWALSGEA